MNDADPSTWRTVRLSALHKARDGYRAARAAFSTRPELHGILSSLDEAASGLEREAALTPPAKFQQRGVVRLYRMTRLERGGQWVDEPETSPFFSYDVIGDSDISPVLLALHSAPDLRGFSVVDSSGDSDLTLSMKRGGETRMIRACFTPQAATGTYQGTLTATINGAPYRRSVYSSQTPLTVLVALLGELGAKVLTIALTSYAPRYSVTLENGETFDATFEAGPERATVHALVLTNDDGAVIWQDTLPEGAPLESALNTFIEASGEFHFLGSLDPIPGGYRVLLGRNSSYGQTYTAFTLRVS